MNDKNIEKPWAVYNYWLGPLGIGKIVNDSEKSCYIEYYEGQMYEPQCWDLEWVKKFKTSKEALDHFFGHNISPHSKEEITDQFLANFPSERINLEKILAQSKP